MESRFWSITDINKYLGFIFLSILFSSTFALSKDLQPQVTFEKGKIEIKSSKSKSKKIISVEFAARELQQQKGLMYRESLPADEGMLFIFDTERTLGFWMKNTYIDLDIAYINKDFKIVDIQTMKATTPLQVEIPTYPSQKPAQYALEMNKNWFQKNKFKVGDTIKIIKN